MSRDPNLDPNLGPNVGRDLHGDLDDAGLAAAIRGSLHRKADVVVASADGLGRIRAAIDDGGRGDGRSARFGAGRPRLWLLTSVAATFALAFGVVGSLTRPGGSDLQTVGQGSQGPVSGATASPTPSGIPVYYPGKVGQTYLLFREFHPWPANGGGEDPVALISVNE